jgi:signal transduction histidine kinase
MNVLIVDDHPTNRKLLRATLEAESIGVLEAGDGEEALKILGSERVDVLVSDILMPNMDGYRFCHEVRRSEKLKHLPLIFYTSTYTSPGDQALAMSVGADRYLTKPISSSELMAAIRETVSQAANNRREIPSVSDTQFMMKQYSKTLVNKLEEKNSELERTVSSLRAAHDRIAELNGVLESRVVERTAQLEAANRQLLQRNEEIQGFYHTLSHELKTPLTSAREFVAIVSEGMAGPVNETQIEYLGLARESCDQMRICLNDLLDSTRLDTGKFTLDLKLCSLNEVIQRAATGLASVAARKQINLNLSVQPNLPEACIDPHRIAQVVNNLVNNALKFTPDGGSIRISTGVAAEKDNCLKVSVSDTGPGISPGHIERIFERLYQVKSSDSATGKGLGLGLYLCRQLIELHGGSIEAQSEPGKGCTFTFFLPRKTVLNLEKSPLINPESITAT